MPVINLPFSPQQSNFDAAVDKIAWWQSLFSLICTTDTDCLPIDRRFLYNWAIVQAILIFVYLHVHMFMQNRSYHTKLHPPLVNENDMLKQIRLLRRPYADFEEQERVRSNLTRGMVRTQMALFFYSYMAKIPWKRIHLEATWSSVEGMCDWIREGDYHEYLSVLEAEHEKSLKGNGRMVLG